MSSLIAVEGPIRSCHTLLLQRIAGVLILVFLSLATIAQANQTVFTTQTPSLPDASDSGKSYEMGMKLQSATSGYITAIRYWKSPSETGTHQGRIWASTGGIPLATVTFTNETASGWQEQVLDTPLNIQSNTTYVVSVNTNNHFAITSSGLATSIVNGDLSSVADGNNGVFGSPGTYPTKSWNNSNYFRDILYVAGPIIYGLSGDAQTGEAGSTLPNPLVIEVRDGNGNPQSGVTVDFLVTSGGGLVSPNSAVTDANGQASTTLTLGSVAGVNTVSAIAAGIGTVNFSATATPLPAPPTQIELTPASVSSNLFNPINYAATIQDQFGNTVTTAMDAVTFSAAGVTGTFSPSATVTPTNGIASVAFTPTTSGIATITASATGLVEGTSSLTVSAIPDQMVFSDQVPSLSDASDGGTSYELGMKFQSSAAGYIKAIRYFKSPSETGTHVGRIWSSTGDTLATVTFTNETGSGWQEQPLNTPLNIQPNSTYVVSANINSHYVVTIGGLTEATVNGDLNSVADGNNGIFGGPGTFPTNSWNNSNYFRDIVFFAGPIMTKASGDNQSGEIGTSLSQPMMVLVQDSYGNPLPGTVVDFVVTSGGGTLSTESALTDTNGLAGTILTLGTTTGLNTVSATAGEIGTVEFTATAQLPVLPPTQLSLSPQTSSTSVFNTVTYQASIQDETGNTVTNASNPVSFTVTGVTGIFDPATPITPTNGIATVTFTPTSTGVATLSASSDGLTSDTANLSVSDQVNQTIFTSETPTSPDASDNGANYEMGMKFQTARSGNITAIRYWRAPNDTGDHTGHIWSVTGDPLATVSFINETTSGWQEQLLATPLPIQPGTSYVVSVNANGRYPVTISGLAGSIVSGDLSSVADGNNGVFGIPGTFPTGSYQNSNYFRDVVFVAGPTVSKLSGDNQNGSVGSTLEQPLVVEIRDLDGTPKEGITVDFTVTAGGGSVTPAVALTDINGQASTTLTLGTTEGLNNVRATVDGIGSVDFTATADVPASSGSTLVLTPLDSSTGVGSAIIYNASILDAYGNLVTTATNPVSFSVSGVTGIFNPAATVIPVNGVASVSFTPSTTGLSTISVASTGLTGDSTSLTVLDPVISIVSGNFQSGIVGSVLSDPLIIEVTDNTSGEPIAGWPVNFTVTTGDGAVSLANVSTEAVGHASTILTLGTLPGIVTVTATAEGVGSVVFTATANAGTPVALGLSSTTASALVYSLVTYEATLLDEFGNLVTDATNAVSFSVSGISGTFNPDSPIVPTNGIASTNFTPTTAGAAIITATSTGLSSATEPLTVTLGSISKISGDNQSAYPSTTLPEALVVEVRDDLDVPLGGVPITFSVIEGSGSVTPTTTVTDQNGLASTSFTLGPLAGIHTVTAHAENVGSVDFTASTPNAITLENQLPGTTEWKITNPVTAVDPEISGYAAATSINVGGTLPLKVSLVASGQYTIDVYRLGYYAGLGGRLMASIGPLNGNVQAPCLVTDPTTRLIECNWSTSHFLQIGTDWTSGIYIANLTDGTTGKQSQIWFVVRDDNSTSDILFQSSFTTFLAYNNYGSQEFRSLYSFNSTGGQRAYKVSFDRPFAQVSSNPQLFDNLLHYEYPMVRWLESQGYDVTYVTNVDVHTDPNLLSKHKLFMSVGHDEYWSESMRNNVEQARDSGTTNLSFFSANTAYWRVRFEPSGIGVPDRVMVCYKDPLANDPIAPTYLWRGIENNRPENALLGIMYTGNDVYSKYGGYDHIVANSADPYYEFTGFNDGDAMVGLVGFEWDAVVPNGFTPSGLVVLSQSIVDPKGIVSDLPPGTDTTISNTTRYTAASGAKVFATGSIQWMWGLDSTGIFGPRVDSRAQQFAVNVLKDMGARPSTPDTTLIIP